MVCGSFHFPKREHEWQEDSPFMQAEVRCAMKENGGSGFADPDAVVTYWKAHWHELVIECLMARLYGVSDDCQHH